MDIRCYKTKRVLPHDSLIDLLDQYVPLIEEKSILVVTSKIVSLCEGVVIAEDQVPSKKELIQKSADAYLDIPENEQPPHAIQITIKNGVLIPSAGIDASNGNGVYILYPENIQESAKIIWEHLKQRDGIKEFGVIISDSHTSPMRWGVTGIGLGWCGFEPLYSYIGKPDCFGIPLRVTKANVLDSLAVAAVFCMGEGNEQTPLALIKNAPRITFQNTPPTKEDIANLSIPLEEDLYAPLLKNPHWVWNHKPLA